MRGGAVQPADDQVLDVKNSDDVVGAVAIDRDAREMAGNDLGDDSIRGVATSSA